ncbi:hypothetical protein J8273_0489 [Carpediemonas membranifera]|uniref:Uncharacterized protein n=1 Tax=Carpediemonas membranifera TaxID=201153 RepID=A0A8J6B909_9EUKA|nr:hypothetical protein J8273_0489 [Carpediemonas membranifera]|eukprot:KAG9395267.1 hypothetical protein J8273_0489 [Carpediemonas membranifera]
MGESTVTTNVACGSLYILSVYASSLEKQVLKPRKTTIFRAASRAPLSQQPKPTNPAPAPSMDPPSEPNPENPKRERKTPSRNSRALANKDSRGNKTKSLNRAVEMCNTVLKDRGVVIRGTKWEQLIYLSCAYTTIAGESAHLAPFLAIMDDLRECSYVCADLEFKARFCAIVDQFEHFIPVQQTTASTEPSELFIRIEEHYDEIDLGFDGRSAYVKERKYTDQRTAVRIWVSSAVAAQALVLVSEQDTLRTYMKENAARKVGHKFAVKQKEVIDCIRVRLEAMLGPEIAGVEPIVETPRVQKIIEGDQPPALSQAPAVVGPAAGEPEEEEPYVARIT